MSVRMFPDEVKFEQRLLKSAGFYKGKIDGKYGPMTQQAEADWEADYLETQMLFGTFDPRSEKCIVTLLPKAQAAARQVMKLAQQRETQTGIKCLILSGTRTYPEQDELYRKIPKVTNTRGGQSNHNFGIAFDIGLFKGGEYLTGASKAEDQAYSDFAKAVKQTIATLEWGGDWRLFPDAPHYQFMTDKSLAQIRNAFEVGALSLA